MPGENERKYVLDVSDPIAFKNTLKKIKDAKAHKIIQSYLNENTRIRWKVKDTTRNDPNPTPKCFFTFKKYTGAEFGVTEIETEISLDDFHALYPHTTGKIEKVRVTIPHDDLKWEVDFFYVHGSGGIVYMVMAEVELPDDVDLPDSIPGFIADNMLYRVRRDDPRFFNTQLSKPDEVTDLLKTIRNTVADAAETQALKDG